MPMYSHRNGEAEYPRVPGHYWWQHPIKGKFATVEVTEADIRFADYIEDRVDVVHKMIGYYLYYGPIPQSDVNTG